jgi:DNA-binding FadR family transcriptional regulator
LTAGGRREVYGRSVLRVPKMAELVAQRLRRQIVRGELSEGDALPSEAVLMGRLNVSRPALREAFRVLESEGLIDIRRGAHGGARVQAPNGDTAARYAGLLLEFRATRLEDVYDARDIIEPACVAILCHRRTPADLRRLRDAIAAARDALDDPLTLIRLHSDFHATVVEAAGNHTMAILHGMVRDIIFRSSYAHTVADAGTPANVRSIHRGFRAHERLVDHVEAREADAAAALWQRHLAEAQDYMLGGSDLKTVLDLLG